MDRTAWRATVHGVTKSQMQLSTQASRLVCVTACVQISFLCASLVAQTVKHLSTIRETWVQSLGQEDPLEKEMAIHSSTVAWKILWTEEPGRLQPMGSQKVEHG